MLAQSVVRRFTFHPSVQLFYIFVPAWAGFINSVGSVGIADILLTAIVLGFFFLGFILGVFEFARLGGVVLLAITGGLAFGIRIILVRDGLVLHGDSLFAVNWAIIAVLGAISGLVLIWLQRVAIVSGYFCGLTNRITVDDLFTSQGLFLLLYRKFFCLSRGRSSREQAERHESRAALSLRPKYFSPRCKYQPRLYVGDATVMELFLTVPPM